MKTVRLTLGVTLAVLVAGCANLPKDGRYQTGGGGWDNFRAEAPAGSAVRSS
jgi:hypothetical protein